MHIFFCLQDDIVRKYRLQLIQICVDEVDEDDVHVTNDVEFVLLQKDEHDSMKNMNSVKHVLVTCR